MSKTKQQPELLELGFKNTLQWPGGDVTGGFVQFSSYNPCVSPAVSEYSSWPDWAFFGCNPPRRDELWQLQTPEGLLSFWGITVKRPGQRKAEFKCPNGQFEFKEIWDSSVKVYLLLSTHVNSPQQPLLLITQQAVDFPHGWQVQLVWAVKAAEHTFTCKF